MPPPARTVTLPPPTPAVSPARSGLAATRHATGVGPGSGSATAGGGRAPAGVAVARQPQAMGNAATAASLLAVPGTGLSPGGPPRATATWATAPAAQGAVGNAAVASGLLAEPAPAGRPAAPRPTPGKPLPNPPGKPVPSPPGAALGAAAPAVAEGGRPTRPVKEDPAAGGKAGPGARRGPDGDPKFAALKKDVRAKKRAVATSHPPAGVEATNAQGAARPPADDKEAQGKAANAEKMNAAEPKDFDKAAFIAAVEKAIAAKAPKNLEEADEFGDSGKAEEVKSEVQSKVGDGKDASQEEIATTTAAPPDTSKAVEKPVVPLTRDRPPGVPGTPDPANAVPDKLPPSATDTSAGPARIDQQMAAAQVTEAQLVKSNEPRFLGAVEAKHTAEKDSVRAQAAMRGHEAKTLADAKVDARSTGDEGMRSIAGTRVTTGKQVGAGKDAAKGRDEAKRAQVTATLQRVFDATKADVEQILSGLDKKVDRQFTDGEKKARDTFTRRHKREMREYKDRRYSGWDGWARWLHDKILDLPAEANQIYVRARDAYLVDMRGVISQVADTVGAELTRAKRRIAQGRADLKAAVDRLPADLKAIGREAAGEFAEKFDELRQSVDDKGTELVDTLAEKYTEALKGVDEEIAAEKEKNKGLVSKAKDAVKGVIDTIIELKNLLLGVLRKAAQAVMAILKDPIGFLGNLVRGVGAGLKLFMKNIGRHLQAGILSWLLGVSARAGIQLPSRFDAKGIMLLIATLLGLNWAFVRGRIERKVPRQAVQAAETAVPLVAKVKKEGAGGLWDDVKARVGDLKKTLISKIIEYLVPTIIIAGITWVLSLLNPASAFIRACKLIIDVVKFVIERARQIIDFVNAVLDAVIAIARGAGGGVPALVERALARSIPVLIGFLAALLGIGGIAGKVKQIFQTLSRPVQRAVDWVIDKLVGLVKALWARLKRAADRRKPRHRPDRKRPRPDRRRPDKKRRPDLGRPRKRPAKPPDKRDRESADSGHQALAAALREARALVKSGSTIESIEDRLPAIRRRHRLTALRLVVDRVVGVTTFFHFEAAINPTAEGPEEHVTLTREQLREEYGIVFRAQEKFQQYADERGLVIDVRPTNLHSVPWLEEHGAIPKSRFVKAKTIDERDTLIGISPAKLGLVGFFLPERRPRAGMAEREVAEKRYTDRVEEYHKYKGDMKEMEPPPFKRDRFSVIEQVIYGYRENGRAYPLAGDNDMFDIRQLDGARLPRNRYGQLIMQMWEEDFGVQHGATRCWITTTEGEARIKADVIRGAADKPIIRFRPHLPPRRVTSETPVEPVDRAR